MPQNPETSDIQSTTITTLVHGGSGLGRCADSRAVFVPLSVPDDQVRFRVRKQHKNYIKAELVEVVVPSSHRIAPACRHFGECGGCDWQMLSYADQCDWKQRLLVQSVSHALGDAAAEKLDSLLPAASSEGYRCRTQFKCRVVRGEFFLGFYRSSSHKIVRVESCPVLHPLLNKLLKPLRNLFAQSDYARRIGQIDAAVDDEGYVRVVVHYAGGNVRAFHAWLAQQVGAWNATFVIRGRGCDNSRHRGQCGDEHMSVNGTAELHLDVGVPGLTLAYGPGDFSQVNLQQNRNLVAMVLELADVEAHDTVYDLYCGVGNFALPLALRAGRVLGVEACAGAIVRARQNARANNIPNTDFSAADVSRYLATAGAARPAPDVVVLDPPRAGAKDAVALLPDTGVKRIVYVSCDQQTMMRDLRHLTGAGFSLSYMRGLDMFPHTHHCEVVALLVRA